VVSLEELPEALIEVRPFDRAAVGVECRDGGVAIGSADQAFYLIDGFGLHRRTEQWDVIDRLEGSAGQPVPEDQPSWAEILVPSERFEGREVIDLGDLHPEVGELGYGPLRYLQHLGLHRQIAAEVGEPGHLLASKLAAQAHERAGFLLDRHEARASYPEMV